MTGCKNEDEGPLTGTLSGAIIYHGQWPDSGAIQLSLFRRWSTSPCSWCPSAAGQRPDHYTPAGYIKDPDTTNGAGPDTFRFILEGISFGTYAAAAVGWRKPIIIDPNRDEPVLGLYGADPYTTDSIPEPLTFTESNPHVSGIVIHAYASRLPTYTTTDTLGTISGVVRLSGSWPSQSLTVLLTTYPFAPWFNPLGPPTAYDGLANASDTTFSFTPRFGTYYLSLWSGGMGGARWLGSVGVNTRAGDARPDGITITQANPERSGIVLNAVYPEPHWISGNVTFIGSRPSEGLLVLLSTYPYAPGYVPQGPPTAYYPITDSTETLYAFTGMTEDTFFVSLWNNVAPPVQPTFFGAYGYTAGSDTVPDPVIISATDYGRNGIDITGRP